MGRKTLEALESMGEELRKSLGMGFGTFSQAGTTTVQAPAPVAATPVAAGPVTLESVAKSVEAIQAQIATIAEAIKPKTETSEAGELRKSVDTIVSEFEDVKKVLDMTMDRVATGEVMRKSAGGDEVLAGQGAAPAAGTTTTSEAMTKTTGSWDKMLRGMRNNPGKPVFLR